MVPARVVLQPVKFGLYEPSKANQGEETLERFKCARASFEAVRTLVSGALQLTRKQEEHLQN